VGKHVLGVVQFYSGRIAPRENRQQWLRTHRPPKKLKFSALASRKLWISAGCKVSPRGHVIRFSKQMIDALKEKASEVVSQGCDYRKLPVPIPYDMVLDAIEIAVQKIDSDMEEESREVARSKIASQQAANYILTLGNETLSQAVDEGYDMRASALRHVIERFEKHCGVKRFAETNRPQDFEARNSPDELAISIYNGLKFSLSEFDPPPFVKISMRKVSRAKVDGKFVTIVPIVFDVPGLSNIHVAWNADSSHA
jgi:hypothetical protein